MLPQTHKLLLRSDLVNVFLHETKPIDGLTNFALSQFGIDLWLKRSLTISLLQNENGINVERIEQNPHFLPAKMV